MSPTSVHPRGCGERCPSCKSEHTTFGSSPRVRGTAAAAAGGAVRHRFIPAGAGNGSELMHESIAESVHPRGCGERRPVCWLCLSVDGSSPRVRGTGLTYDPDSSKARFIPAGAGNGAAGSSQRHRRPVHPRGCGERVPGGNGCDLATGSSPRVRGTAYHP